MSCPCALRGIDAYRASWTDQPFPWLSEAGAFEVRDRKIRAGDDLAFCHGLILQPTQPSAERTDELTVRLTIGLMKINGTWTVVNEHHSEPSS